MSVTQLTEGWRKRVATVTESSVFGYFIFTCVILNVLSLGILWYGAPKKVYIAVNVLSYIFAVIFIFELIIKITAQGFRLFFRDNWNSFDFVIIFVTVLAEIASLAGGSKLGHAVNAIRILRVQRLFRYIKRFKKIRIIF